MIEMLVKFVEGTHVSLLKKRYANLIGSIFRCVLDVLFRCDTRNLQEAKESSMKRETAALAALVSIAGRWIISHTLANVPVSQPANQPALCLTIRADTLRITSTCNPSFWCLGCILSDQDGRKYRTQRRLARNNLSISVHYK